MPAYENRSIGGDSNLRVCRFESDRWHHARVAQSGRGCRLKPGPCAGSNPAARTMGDMTRWEERRTPNPFLQGSNPWSPANSSHRKLIGEAAACRAAHGEFDSHPVLHRGRGRMVRHRSRIPALLRDGGSIPLPAAIPFGDHGDVDPSRPGKPEPRKSGRSTRRLSASCGRCRPWWATGLEYQGPRKRSRSIRPPSANIFSLTT
jgi:hypothetical protein